MISNILPGGNDYKNNFKASTVVSILLPHIDPLLSTKKIKKFFSSSSKFSIVSGISPSSIYNF